MKTTIVHAQLTIVYHVHYSKLLLIFNGIPPMKSEQRYFHKVIYVSYNGKPPTSTPPKKKIIIIITK